MGANNYYNSARVLKLSICQAICVFCVIVLIMPDASARGDHGGGNLLGSGSHGGHGRHFGGSSQLGGGHRHFNGGHRHLGNHRHFGGGRHRHFRSGYRSYFGGSFYGGHRNGYFPGRYNYAYVPRAYSYSSYRPRYSPLSYTRSYNYPTNYTRRNNAYSYNSASARYPSATANNYPANEASDVGWQLLSQNNSSEALNVFADKAGRHPKDGVPKVGYALSAAMQNDLNRAAWAMRRAFRIDPGSLHYLKIDAALRIHIETLLADYQYQLKYAHGNRHFDVAFMIVALNYLIHGNEAARIAIQESVEKLGDNSPSAINLQRLVVENKY